MDLDVINASCLEAISRERGDDGKLTARAKEARRSLGRCLRCNQEGHIAMFCTLHKRIQTLSTFLPYVVEEPHQEAKSEFI